MICEAYLVKTQSQSVYEVIPDQQLVRRMTGMHEPTPRQGKDGEWKAFTSLVAPLVGTSMWFDWQGDGRGTITSPIETVVPTKIMLTIPLKTGEQEEEDVE